MQCTSTYRSSDNPTKRVPRSVIKPVQKWVVPIHSHVVCGTIVEPGGQRERERELVFQGHITHT